MAIGDALHPRMTIPVPLRTFYVDEVSGSDDYSVAQAQNPHLPWKSMQKPCDTCQAGDHVEFSRGVYAHPDGETHKWSPPASRAGTEANPVVFYAREGHVPIVLGGSGGGGWGSAFVWEADEDEHPEYFLLRGSFIFQPHPLAPDSADKLIEIAGDEDHTPHHIEIDGITVRDALGQGIFSDYYSEDCQFWNMELYNCGRHADHAPNLGHGMYLQGYRHVIANNDSHDHPHGSGIQIWPHGHGIQIVHNTCLDNARHGIVLGGEASDSHPTNELEDCVVAGNICEGNLTGINGLDEGLTDFADNIAPNNLCHDNSAHDFTTSPDLLDFYDNLEDDPELSENHRIPLDSPAVDAGLLSYCPPTDRNGDARTTPDLGAYVAGLEEEQPALMRARRLRSWL